MNLEVFYTDQEPRKGKFSIGKGKISIETIYSTVVFKISVFLLLKENLTKKSLLKILNHLDLKSLPSMLQMLFMRIKNQSFIRKKRTVREVARSSPYQFRSCK